MATNAMAAKQSKGKKMNPNVTIEIKDPSKIKGTVNKKVDNPFTGKEIVSTGKFELDAAVKTLESALNLVGQSEEEVCFWFNQGRKMQAKQQMLGLLGFDLGSETLNDLFKAFKDAMNGILPKNADEAKRKRIREFILSEDKFEPIREKLNAMAEAGLDEIFVKFGTPSVPVEKDGKVTIELAEGETLLRKPTGKKGRTKKVDPNAPEVPETSDSDDDDSDDDDTVSE